MRRPRSIRFDGLLASVAERPHAPAPAGPNARVAVVVVVGRSGEDKPAVEEPMSEAESIVSIVTKRKAVIKSGMTEARMTEATWAHHSAVPGGRTHRRSDADGHNRDRRDRYLAHHDCCSVGCVKRPG
jgi:hypothetical protein